MIWISSITKDTSARKKRKVRLPKDLVNKNQHKACLRRKLRVARVQGNELPEDVPRLPVLKETKDSRLNNKRSIRTKEVKSSKELELQELKASVDLDPKDSNKKVGIAAHVSHVNIVKATNNADLTDQEVEMTLDPGTRISHKMAETEFPVKAISNVDRTDQEV